MKFSIKISIFLFLFSGFFVITKNPVFAVTYDVDIKASGPAGAFNPSSLTINTGDTVRWTSLGEGHQVASDAHPNHYEYPDPVCPNASCWDSPLLFTNDTYSFTFLIGGAWDYHNHQLPGRTGTITVTDLNTPATTSDLTASNPASASIDLAWTSPGDDVGSTGNFLTPTIYDIRYSISTITEGNWASATQVTSEPSPQIAGSSESMTVTGLSSEITYYFAMKTSDEVPNTSALSNVTSATTLPPSDSIFPDPITNLAASALSGSSVKLTWTASGDDGSTGTATTYDVRYSTSTITEDNWASATQISAEPAPQIAGSAESMTIGGLDVLVTYYFVIKVWDEEPNISALSNVPSATTLAEGAGSTPAEDIFRPAAITDLQTQAIEDTSNAKLTWTAPSDDDLNYFAHTGTVTSYDIRYSKEEITSLDWTNAIKASGEPTPSKAGSPETFIIKELDPLTVYYFGIRSLDERPNESALSNVASVTTNIFMPIDIIPPDPVLNLDFIKTSPTAIKLNWTSSGDDNNTGIAKSYDIRYLVGEEITEDNWADAIQFIQEPIPQETNSKEEMEIFGFDHETTYYVALKVSDEADNISLLSNIITFTTPPVPESIKALQDNDLIKLYENPKIYVIRNGKKLWIPTLEAFEAQEYRWQNIQEFEEEAFFSVSEAELIRIQGKPEVYQVIVDKKRHIPTAEAFINEGYSWESITEIGVEIASWYKVANLLRAKDGAKVYLIEGATKRWIKTEEAFLGLGYSWKDILELPLSTLDSYSAGEDIT